MCNFYWKIFFLNGRFVKSWNFSSAKIALYKSMRTICAQPCIQLACLLSDIWHRLLSLITMKPLGLAYIETRTVLSASLFLTSRSILATVCRRVRSHWAKAKAKANVRAKHFFDLCRSVIWTTDWILTFAFVPCKRAFSNGFYQSKRFHRVRGEQRGW